MRRRSCAACGGRLAKGEQFCQLCGFPADVAAPQDALLIVAPRRSKGLLFVLGAVAVSVAALAVVYLSGVLDPKPRFTLTLTHSRGSFSDGQLRSLTKVVTARVNAVNGRVIEVTRDGKDAVSVTLALPKDFTKERAAELFGSRAGRLEFVDVGSIADSATVAALRSGAEGVELRPGTYTPFIAGEDIVQANFGRDPTGAIVVDLAMTAKGAGVWSQYTASHVGKQVAVALDGKVRAAPMVTEQITDGMTRISGDFTAEDAESLVVALQNGFIASDFTLTQIR